MRNILKAVAFATALLVSGVSLPAQTGPLQAFGNHGVWLTIPSRSTTATQRITATWGYATDGRLSAEQYYVTAALLNGEVPWALERVQATLSITFEIPLRMYFADSVGVRVVVRAGRKGVIGTDSVWAVRYFRRQQTAADVAHADSFPAANHRQVLCSTYGQRVSDEQIARFLAFNLAKKVTLRDSSLERNYWESIRTGPDSVLTSQGCGADWCMTKGYRYPIAMLAKNRYTGRVTVHNDEVVWSSPDPEITFVRQGSGSCSGPVAAWESERSS